MSVSLTKPWDSRGSRQEGHAPLGKVVATGHREEGVETSPLQTPRRKTTKDTSWPCPQPPAAVHPLGPTGFLGLVGPQSCLHARVRMALSRGSPLKPMEAPSWAFQILACSPGSSPLRRNPKGNNHLTRRWKFSSPAKSGDIGVETTTAQAERTMGCVHFCNTDTGFKPRRGKKRRKKNPRFIRSDLQTRHSLTATPPDPRATQSFPLHLPNHVS